MTPREFDAKHPHPLTLKFVEGEGRYGLFDANGVEVPTGDALVHALVPTWNGLHDILAKLRQKEVELIARKERALAALRGAEFEEYRLAVVVGEAVHQNFARGFEILSMEIQLLETLLGDRK